MRRLLPSDDIGQAITKLSDGNRLAGIALQVAHTNGACIDPDTGADAGRSTFQQLDELGIYGADIERLFRDVCGCDPTKLMATCLAVKHGLLQPDEAIAIAKGATTKDMDDLVQAVQRIQPAFGCCNVDTGCPDCESEGGVF